MHVWQACFAKAVGRQLFMSSKLHQGSSRGVPSPQSSQSLTCASPSEQNSDQEKAVLHTYAKTDPWAVSWVQRLPIQHLFGTHFILCNDSYSGHNSHAMFWHRQHCGAEGGLGGWSVPLGEATGCRGVCECRAGGASYAASPHLDPPLHPCLHPSLQAPGQFEQTCRGAHSSWKATHESESSAKFP